MSKSGDHYQELGIYSLRFVPATVVDKKLRCFIFNLTPEYLVGREVANYPLVQTLCIKTLSIHIAS